MKMQTKMRKILYFVPLFMLLGVVIIIGLLYFIIPNVVTSFLSGFWSGVKAPVVCIFNIFGSKFDFYNNPTSSNFFNFGFLAGVYIWSSPFSIFVSRTNK